MTTDDRALAIANARTLCAELLDEFESIKLASKNVNWRLLPVAFAWANQVRRFVQAALKLDDAGFEHEALVLQRQALEYTVRLHWLCKLGDGAVDTLLDDHKRSIETLATDAADGPLGIPAEYLEELRGGIVKTCGLSVGGQLHLPADGQLKLPGHGHLVTQRADAE